MLYKYIVLIASVALLGSCNSEELPVVNDLTAAIISAADLAVLLQVGDSYKLLEVSPSEEYLKGHITSAMSIWRPQYESDDSIKGLRANRSQMESQLSSMGIQSSDTIILYDHAYNVDACRLFWILEMYGHPHLRILDGGKKAWVDLGHKLDSADYEIKRSEFKFINPTDESMLASGQDVLNAVHRPEYVLVDTRNDEEFYGKPFEHKGEIVDFKPGASTSGTIKGARHFHWTRCSQFKSPYGFKSSKDIIHEFKAEGIDPYEDMIVFCQSGARSAHTWFVLKHIIGNDKVKNYDGSWIEWSGLYIKQDSMITRHSSHHLNEIISDSLNQLIKISNG